MAVCLHKLEKKEEAFQYFGKVLDRIRVENLRDKMFYSQYYNASRKFYKELMPFKSISTSKTVGNSNTVEEEDKHLWDIPTNYDESCPVEFELYTSRLNQISRRPKLLPSWDGKRGAEIGSRLHRSYEPT